MSHEEPLEITVAVWLGVAVAIMAAMQTSQAKDLMSLEPGAEIEKVAIIGGKRLALPAGRWELVLSGRARRAVASSTRCRPSARTNARRFATDFATGWAPERRASGLTSNGDPSAGPSTEPPYRSTAGGNGRRLVGGTPGRPPFKNRETRT